MILAVPFAELVRRGAARARLVCESRRVEHANTALDLSFYGDFRTIGTLYWENRAGLHAMAEIAAAASDAEAETLVRRHAITHFVFCTEDDVLDEILRLARPHASADELNQAFAPRIFHSDEIPSWLRALPDVTLASSPSGTRVQIFAVDFTQTAGEAQFHLANMLAQRGETARALAAFTRSATLGFAPAALRRAEFLLATQRWNEAIPALEQAIAGAPPAARYRLLTQAGGWLAEGRQHGAAVRFFERALHEQVTDTRAANGLAWLLATAAEVTPAQRDFARRLAQQSTRLDPSVPESWSALGAALAATGDWSDALRALERAEKLVIVNTPSALPKRLAAQREAYLAGRLYRD